MNEEPDRLFAHLVAYSSDVMTLHNSKGHCLYVSPSVQNFLGYTPDDFMTLNMSSVIHPDDIDQIQNALAVLQGHQELMTLEFRMLTAWGEEIWVETTAKQSPHPSLAGEFAIVATTRDVTKRKIAESQLAASEQTNRTLVNLLPDMIAIHRDNRLIYINPAGLNLLEVDNEEDIIGKNIISLIHPSYQELAKRRLDKIQHDGQIEMIEQRMVTLKGNEIDVEACAATIDYQGTPAFLALVRDITQHKRIQRQLHEMNYQLQLLSTHDALTGVGNRRCFDETLEQAFALNNQQTISLIMLDIDCFKPYNDAYGHPQGDACLQAIAGAMVQASGINAVVTRYGGEEFAIILPLTDTSGAAETADLIQQNIHRLSIEHCASPVQPFVTVSIGIGSIHPNESATPNILIRRADAALYQAKQSGRDRTEIWRD